MQCEIASFITATTAGSIYDDSQIITIMKLKNQSIYTSHTFSIRTNHTKHKTYSLSRRNLIVLTMKFVYAICSLAIAASTFGGMVDASAGSIHTKIVEERRFVVFNSRHLTGECRKLIFARLIRFFSFR
jgi:hypothetical protein